MVYSRETLEAGALRSWPNQVTMFERTAGYVVRILSKAKNRPACPSTSQRHLS
jgi:hypothetical protein